MLQGAKQKAVAQSMRTSVSAQGHEGHDLAVVNPAVENDVVATADAGPLTPGDEAAVAKRISPKQAMAVVHGVLGIDARKVESYMKDPSCAGIVEYIIGLVNFNQQYLQTTFLGSELSGMKVQALNGEKLPEELEHLTVRELSARLRDRIAANAGGFCEAFRSTHFLLAHGLKNAERYIRMQAELDPDEPVDAEDMASALQAEELGDSIKNLGSRSEELVTEAKFLLHNMQTGNHKLKNVSHLIEKKHKAEEELRELEVEEARLREKFGLATEHMTRVLKEREQIAAAKQGPQEHLRFLESKLESKKEKLKEAEKRLKDYTFWMFGDRTYMWENDVRLAERQVPQYEQEIEKLEDDIRQHKASPNDWQQKINDAEATNAGGCKKAQMDESEARQQHQKFKKKVESKVANVSWYAAEIEGKLDAEGLVSYAHLEEVTMGLNSFALFTERITQDSRGESKAWVNQLRNLKALTKFVLKGKDLMKQKRAIESLLKELEEGEPFLQLLKEARPPNGLSLPLDLTDGVVPQKQIAQSYQPAK